MMSSIWTMVAFSSGPAPLTKNIPNRYRRSLQQTGLEACSNCIYANGQECVGRTVTDDNCAACANGQKYWPCDVVSECWCWDTSKPRDPPEDADNAGEGGGGGAKVQACKGCGALDTEECVGNQNALTPTADEDCAGCMNGQHSYWPCDVPDLCWCWDNTQPKKPPAPASGFSVALDVRSPCEILTEDLFHMLAPNATFPYTYDGLCTAIDAYNAHHTEKFAAMGNEVIIRAELAAFLGNTLHESDDYEAAREYLVCGDRKEVEGKVYCKPCTNDQYNWTTHTCLLSMVAENSPYNSYCQSTFMPPTGCACNETTQVKEEGNLAGYIDASKVFYGRGAIQLSWNYNYVRASVALTGDADTFCNDPEQIATSAEYTWGTAIFFWMENVKEGWTCHKEIMMNEDFGGTLSNINGGLECPAYKGGWHHSAIKMRLNRYCHAASLLGMTKISSLDGCSGMSDTFEECLADGQCPFCYQYADSLPTNATKTTGSESTMDDYVQEQFTSSLVPSRATSSMPTSVMTMLTLSSPTPSLRDDSHTPTIQESSTALPSNAIKILDSTVAPTLTPSTYILSNSPSSRMPSKSSPTTALPTLSPSQLATDELIGEIQLEIENMDEEDWSEASITSATILKCGKTQEDALKNYCTSEGYDCPDGDCFNGSKCFMVEDACETSLANTNDGVLGQYCAQSFAELAAVCGTATMCTLQEDCPNGTYCWKEFLCVDSTTASPSIASFDPPSTLTSSEIHTGNYSGINIDAFITDEVDSSPAPTSVYESSLEPSQEVTMMSSSHKPTSFESLTELTDIIGLVEAVEFEFASMAPTASPTTNQPSPPVKCEHTVSSFLCSEGYTGWKSRNGCREYYWCHSGCFQDVIYDCGTDLLFDKNLELCTFASQVKCPEIIANPSQSPSLRPFNEKTGATIEPFPKTNELTQYSGGVVGEYNNSTDYDTNSVEEQSLYETPPWLLSTAIQTSSTSSVLVAPNVSPLLTSVVVLSLLFHF